MSATRKTSLPLPEAILEKLKAQMKVVAEQHNQDLAAGYDVVFLDDAVETKYPKAPAGYDMPVRTVKEPKSPLDF